jgi:hypothetical protein
VRHHRVDERQCDRHETRQPKLAQNEVEEKDYRDEQTRVDDVIAQRVRSEDSIEQCE